MTTTVAAPTDEHGPPAPAAASAPGRLSSVRAASVSHGPALAGLAGLTVLFYWPLLGRITSRVMSDGADGASFLWNYHDVARAVGHLSDPFVTHQAFFPVGANTAFDTNTPLWSLISWPLAAVLGLGLAASALGLVVVLLGAAGAYFLALRECGNRAAAFAAGVGFGFFPRHLLATVQAYNLAHTGLLAFGLLALLALYDRPTRWRAAVAGALLGATVLTDYTLAVFLVLGGVVVAAVRWRRTATRLMLGRLSLAAGVGLVLSLPVLVPAGAAAASGELGPLPGYGGADAFSADLLSWVVPPASHPWWGARVAGLSGSTGGIHLAYPGLVMLGLGVAGLLLARGRQRLTWGLLAGLFFLLSLGPFLHVAGHAGGGFRYLGDRFAVPLPYLGLRLVPGLGELRVPARFAEPATLAVDVLAAIALARAAGAIAARRARGTGGAGRRLALALPLGAAALTVAEFQTTYLPLQPAAVPAAYRSIAASRDGGAVLELPLQWRDGTHRIGDNAMVPGGRDDTLFLYWATSYRQPLVSGMVARLPNRRWAALTADPLYRQLLALEREPGYTDRPTFSAADLRRAGIGFVVLHRDRPLPAAAAYLARLGLRQIADDGTVVVLETPPPAPPPSRGSVPASPPPAPVSPTVTV